MHLRLDYVLRGRLKFTNHGPTLLDFAELRQVYIPTQHHSHSVGDRQVEFIVSDQKREAEYHHHTKPHIVPSDANRRPGRLSSPSRGLQNVIHDRRIQYLPYQQEKMIPSEEGIFRPLKYQQRVSNDFVEQRFKPAPESTVSTYREERTPRVIDLGDTEVPATKKRRVNDLVVLSPEMSSQPSRDYHQERSYLISRNHDNEWSGSNQNRPAFVHQSFPLSLPREDHPNLGHHPDTMRYLDRQRPAQTLQTRIDVASQQPHVMNERRERTSYHERIEVPLVGPSSAGKSQAFLDSTHKSDNFPQSFSTPQHSHKQLPVLHGSLRPHITSHRDGVQPRREPVYPGGLDVSTSSPAIFDEYGQGMQSDLAGLSIRPEYRRHFIEDGHGGFDTNQKAYLTSLNDPRDVHAYERPRTGIFLREVGSSRQSIPDNCIFHPTEVQSHPLLPLQSSQYSNIEPTHGTFERQKEMSIMETSRRKPILELSRSENFLRYVSGSDPPHYIRLHRISL